MIPLPDLSYPYDALAPVVSEATMRLHHDKHHAKYVDVVNTLIADDRGSPVSLEALIRRAALAGDRKLFNNAAQAWNHAFFWRCMTPNHAPPTGALRDAIITQFGDLEGLRSAFVAEGASHFGSGWVWLAVEQGKLKIFSTHDADTLVTRDLTPLLVCDVWEHAYYLDHKSDRAGFLGAWWDRLANWSFAQGQFAAAGGGTPWRHPEPIDIDVPQIADHGAFERALAEATALLDRPPAAGSLQHRRFRQLLDRIAGYCGDGQRDQPVHALPDSLEAKLREAARHLAEGKVDGSHPWSPMVGGDIRPHPLAAPHG